MKNNLVKSMLVVAVLALAASASAQTVHDCRIRSLGIKATVSGDVLTLRAIYRGFDGLPLSLSLCPDLNGPTWGGPRAFQAVDPFGYVVSLSDPTGELITVSVATIQRPDRVFYFETLVRF